MKWHLFAFSTFELKLKNLYSFHKIFNSVKEAEQFAKENNLARYRITRGDVTEYE